jgi:hypothetical protein
MISDMFRIHCPLWVLLWFDEMYLVYLYLSLFYMLHFGWKFVFFSTGL